MHCDLASFASLRFNGAVFNAKTRRRREDLARKRGLARFTPRSRRQADRGFMRDEPWNAEPESIKIAGSNAGQRLGLAGNSRVVLSRRSGGTQLRHPTHNMKWLRRIFGGKQQPDAGLREVPGALVARTLDGRVAYNILTPHMQQFMGRCVSAIKRSGIAAKGTGQFSILLGEQRAELRLDQFYQPTDDPTIVEQVVAESRRITNAV
jgi:hypothetical protein